MGSTINIKFRASKGVSLAFVKAIALLKKMPAPRPGDDPLRAAPLLETTPRT